MKTLTLEQLLELHALVIAETGGSAGLRDMGRLEAAIASQTQSVFGEELYLGMYEKATALIRGLIADHPFTDGNKRTAILTGLTFLKMNAIEFNSKTGEIEDFAVEIATKHLDVAVIAKWLKQRCKVNK